MVLELQRWNVIGESHITMDQNENEGHFFNHIAYDSVCAQLMAKKECTELLCGNCCREEALRCARVLCRSTVLYTATKKQQKKRQLALFLLDSYWGVVIFTPEGEFEVAIVRFHFDSVCFKAQTHFPRVICGHCAVIRELFRM